MCGQIGQIQNLLFRHSQALKSAANGPEKSGTKSEEKKEKRC